MDAAGRITWWCFPRFDSDPILSRLLAGDVEKGFCDVVLEGAVASESAYSRNTAVVQTTLRDAAGNALRITDFMPRFKRFERVFNPPQIFRRIEPVAGLPRIKIRVRPTFNYGGPCTSRAIGSNHIRYSGGADTLRVTTDAALSYIVHETSFALIKPVTLILGPDEPFEAAVDTASREFLERTRDYWLDWVRSLAIPLEYQAEIIRAAISLKLCNFEETGAIIAAHTTSIPEAPGTQRTWDYRFCWLRDAFFVIKALNRLGATQTMEDYIHYITNIGVEAGRPLRPVYGIVPAESLEERIATELAGFQGCGPVRVGNQAAEQLQHDSYGSVILAASQMFIDERLPSKGDADLFRRLEPLGVQARRFALEPDAGPWEHRVRQRVHTHSATMCWVACDRLARIAARLGLADRAAHWHAEAEGLRHEILKRAWNERLGVLAGALDTSELDASVLLLPELGLLPANDETIRAHLRAHRQGAEPQRLHHALHRPGRLRPAGDRLSRVPVLVYRRARLARTHAGGAGVVRRSSDPPQQLRSAVGGHRSGHRRALGQPAANLLDGGHRQHGPHRLAQLAGSLGADLIDPAQRARCGVAHSLRSRGTIPASPQCRRFGGQHNPLLHSQFTLREIVTTTIFFEQTAQQAV